MKCASAVVGVVRGVRGGVVVVVLVNCEMRLKMEERCSCRADQSGRGVRAVRHMESLFRASAE